jgi:hypothetical protein
VALKGVVSADSMMASVNPKLPSLVVLHEE